MTLAAAIQTTRTTNAARNKTPRRDLRRVETSVSSNILTDDDIAVTAPSLALRLVERTRDSDIRPNPSRTTEKFIKTYRVMDAPCHRQ